jgi:outer membrane lipoprotein-sorting protein
MRRQREFMLKILVILAVTVGGCSPASRAEQTSVSQQGGSNSVDKILTDLRKATSELKSYQCRIEYLFSQPILESKTLRTGTLYYARQGESSKLRIDFNTLSQDDGPQQKYIESYIFDGQWLTHIDYQIKQVQKRQLAEANEPIDAFELVTRNFPIIGFSETEDLKKEFDINLINEPAKQTRLTGGGQTAGKPDGQIHLHLKVRPDSQYKDDYKTIDILLDKKLMLPSRLTAVSTQDDIYEISFISPVVNGPIDEKVFDFTIPKDFGKPEIIPLKN